MNSQLNNQFVLTQEQQGSLSDNLSEALEILFKSVAKRMVKEKIEKIKNEVRMKDEGEEYGKYNRL